MDLQPLSLVFGLALTMVPCVLIVMVALFMGLVFLYFFQRKFAREPPHMT